jgi:hypothetical protein
MSNESTTERREFARFNGINFPQFRYAINDGMMAHHAQA